jgi:hypothetical protein
MSTKRTISTLMASAAVALVAGCIPSLYPIHSEQDVVTRHEILGRWTSDAESQSWQFTQRDGDSYKLVLVDKTGQSGALVTHLTEIDGQLFMDLYPIRSGPAKPGFYDLHWLPAHTFFRVELDGDSLSLAFIDPQWLKKHVEEYPELSWQRPNENAVLLTTETAELRNFVGKLLDTDGAFTNPFELTRAQDDLGT